MQYYKHFSNMRHDLKIKRLIAKYGIEGYGLYNLILESITESLTTSNPIPELQDTCEDLAEFYNGNTAKIDEIVAFMINQGLFELSEITGRILCNKLYKFLEQSQTRSPEIRDMIKSWHTKTKLIGMSETVTDKSERIRIRKEKEEEKKKTFIIPTLEEIRAYIKENNYNVDPEYFFNYFTTGNWIDSKGNKVKNWKQKVITWASKEKKKEPEFTDAYEVARKMEERKKANE